MSTLRQEVGNGGMAQYQVKGNTKERVTSIHCPSMHVQVFSNTFLYLILHSLIYYYGITISKQLGGNSYDLHISTQ